MVLKDEVVMITFWYNILPDNFHSYVILVCKSRIFQFNRELIEQCLANGQTRKQLLALDTIVDPPWVFCGSYQLPHKNIKPFYALTLMFL